MKKLEKIQEAYGEYWDECKNYIDTDGWIKVGTFHNNEPIDFEIFGIELESMLEDVPFGIFKEVREIVRPKSLQGIEHNNGWIKINSESDLPEQGGEYIVFRMNKKSKATYCKKDRWIIPENCYPKTTFQHGITHYREKEIIPNPIY